MWEPQSEYCFMVWLVGVLEYVAMKMDACMSLVFTQTPREERVSGKWSEDLRVYEFHQPFCPCFLPQVRAGCNFLCRVCQDEYQLFFHFFNAESTQLK